MGTGLETSDAGDASAAARYSEGKMSAIYMFTLESDLFALLSRIETQHKIKYVKAGRIDGRTTEEFDTFTAVPNLGRALGRREGDSGVYLIVEKGCSARVETMKMFDGNLRFDVEQSLNPDSILFRPGGEWKEQTIIRGDFSTISDSEVSSKLIRAVRSAIRRDFTKIDRYFWLGPDALQALRSGWRLTQDADMSPDYDVKET